MTVIAIIIHAVKPTYALKVPTRKAADSFWVSKSGMNNNSKNKDFCFVPY